MLDDGGGDCWKGSPRGWEPLTASVVVVVVVVVVVASVVAA